MGIREGTLVELSVSKDCLVATPAHLQTLRLKDLLAKVTKANIHPEVDLQ
jgi:antitoxin component of MazEF toxin-antitoxin module